MGKYTADEIVDLWYRHGSVMAVHKATGIHRNTITRYLKQAGLSPDQDRLEIVRLRKEVSDLRRDLKQAEHDALDERTVRREIMGLRDQRVAPPSWFQGFAQECKGRTVGVPMTIWSDWHWAERVDPSQVFWVNAYNLEIARTRAQRLVDRTLDLLIQHMVDPAYPGIVVNLGGDMLSGFIHEELEASNEVGLLDAFNDLLGHLIAALNRLVEQLGRVAVITVPGNHSRLYKKPRAKDKGFGSLDWLLGQMLERWFKNDERFHFLSGHQDVQYNVYGWRFRLTHGEQFKGGTGFIGAYAPITRGELKKRIAATSYNAPYDYLLLGHHHQQMSLPRAFVNGSLKGYDEFALTNQFTAEAPQQMLWIVHPQRGVTYKMDVQVDELSESVNDLPWIDTSVMLEPERV